MLELTHWTAQNAWNAMMKYDNLDVSYNVAAKQVCIQNYTPPYPSLMI